MIRKHKIRWFAILIVGAIILASLFYHSLPTTLYLGLFIGGSWDVPSPQTYAFVDRVIARFEKQNPKIHVEYEPGIRREDYSLWLDNQILEGKGPDVFLILDEDFSTYANIGALKKLNRFISEDTSFDPTRFFESSLNDGRLYADQYALPLESNPEMMFVNTSLLEKEGIELLEQNWDLDTFYSICQKVTKDRDGDDIIDQFGSYGYKWTNAINAYGVNLFEDSGKSIRLDQERVQEALHLVMDLEDLHNGVNVLSEDLDQGNVAFAPMSYAEFITYNPYPWRIKKYSDFEWDCISMPLKYNDMPLFEGDSVLMGISSQTKHSSQSWELLKMFCFDPQTQAEVILNGQGISALQLEYLDQQDAIHSYFEEMNLSGSAIDTMMNGTSLRKHFRKYESAMSLLDTNLKTTVLVDEDMDLVLTQLQKEINRFLQE